MASTRRSVLAALIASPVLVMADSDLSAAPPIFVGPHAGLPRRWRADGGSDKRPLFQAQCTSEARPCGRCAEGRTDHHWRICVRYCNAGSRSQSD